MGHPIRVLCVDDDPSLAELVATYLQEDYDDITAVPETDPHVALDRVRSETFDCIVSDYQMPGMNGLELLDQARDLRPEIPFILFTGQGSETVASDAVSAGVTDYIRKATGTEQYDLLVNRVRNAVDRHRAELDYQTIFDGVTDAILVVDPSTGSVIDVNRAFCELWGYDETNARSLSPADLTVEDAGAERLCDPSNEKRDIECVTAEGERFWASVSVKRADIRGTERILAIVRDVTERHEREEALSALVGAEQTLLKAETSAAVCERATELATDALGFDAVQLLLRDETGTLRTAASVGPVPVDDEVFAAARRQIAADVLGTAELQTRRDISAVGRYPNDFPMRSELRVPIGDHGVLVGNTSDERAFGPYEHDLARVLSTNVTAALERTDREELLRERESELERQRDELTSLNHTNRVIRKINQTLVEVSSRDEIERVVCEQLAAADQYRMAWIGEYDLVTRELDPKVWAGIEDGYLRGRTVSVDEYESNPYRTAVDQRSIAVQPLTPDTVPQAKYERATERGYRAVAVIPLVHQGTLYDVLGVYAGQSDAFGETERAVLSELGETIGYAMHAVEQRRTILTDNVTELEIELRSEESLLVQLAAATGCRVELDGLIVQSDGSLKLFVTVEGNPSADAVTAAEDVDAEWTAITETETSSLYELTLSRAPIIDFLAENGATLRTASAEGTTGRLVIQLPSQTDSRELLDLLADVYGDVNLLTQRERSRKPQTTTEFKSSLQADLTDRQHEVLRTAHHAGFFEWPRVTSGEELASSLGISQSTFHEHLRAGERKLVGTFFDGDESDYT